MSRNSCVIKKVFSPLWGGCVFYLLLFAAALFFYQPAYAVETEETEPTPAQTQIFTDSIKPFLIKVYNSPKNLIAGQEREYEDAVLLRVELFEAGYHYYVLTRYKFTTVARICERREWIVFLVLRGQTAFSDYRGLDDQAIICGDQL